MARDTRQVNPILYEINTRCWLRELSGKNGGAVTLANVPDAEFTGWQQRGFTHIWLMGVWTTGPRSRSEALKSEGLKAVYKSVLPDWREEDVPGSPYAIADYQVPAVLGGEEGLRSFRAKLHARGLKLVLDFVPNHLGLDHAWVSQRPELFVQSAEEAPETFRQQTRNGPRRLAHGKDPYFPAWTDTVQLDYRRPETRGAIIQLLQSVSDRCDGVRCDMAMLLLNEVIAKTWAHLPTRGEQSTTRVSEFWGEAIPAVKRSNPEFLFLAEAYWDLEARLQGISFDYTYDKRLFDFLTGRRNTDIHRHLLGASAEFVRASAHFLENHDELRIAPRLSAAEHRAAALVILGLPGMRFLHEGQLTGSRIHVPVQLSRRPVEPVVPEIAALYEQLLTAITGSAAGRGEGKLLRPRSAWPGNPTAENFIIVQWRIERRTFDLAVVNLAPHRSQCYVPLEIEELPLHNWRMRDLLGKERYERFGDDLQKQGLYLDLPAHGAQLFHFEPMHA